jgi:hypothetical protein
MRTAPPVTEEHEDLVKAMFEELDATPRNPPHHLSTATGIFLERSEDPHRNSLVARPLRRAVTTNGHPGWGGR